MIMQKIYKKVTRNAIFKVAKWGNISWFLCVLVRQFSIGSKFETQFRHCLVSDGLSVANWRVFVRMTRVFTYYFVIYAYLTRDAYLTRVKKRLFFRLFQCAFFYQSMAWIFGDELEGVGYKSSGSPD